MARSKTRRAGAENQFLVKLERSSTNFQLQLFEFFKRHKWDTKWDFLKFYQNVAREYINNVEVDARGLLIYHTMGLGKSILAVSIAMDQISNGRQVIVLLTKSLQENMRGAIKKYINLRKQADPEYNLGQLSETELDNWIKKNFSFVSMNASNMLKQMGKAAEGKSTEEFDAALEKRIGEVLKIASLDGKLLIVDEAHNLFRAITNGSKNAIGLYDLVMKAKNLKCMFLTGTPVANDPFELVPCFNMLGSRHPGQVTLPENYKDFNAYFVDSKTGRIKNKEKFQNRILGLVSHVTHNSAPGAAIGVQSTTAKVEFPTELPTVVEKVPMSPEQYVLYQLARDKEREEGQSPFGPGGGKGIYDTPSMQKPKSKAASSYRVRSRQLSNFCPPEGFREEKNPSRIPKERLSSPKYDQIYQNTEKHKNQLGIVYSQFVGVGGLGTYIEYLKEKGWEEVIFHGQKKSKDITVREFEAAPPGAQGEKDEWIDDDEVAPNVDAPTVEVTESGEPIIGEGEMDRAIPPQTNPDTYMIEIEQELENVNWLVRSDDDSGLITIESCGRSSQVDPDDNDLGVFLTKVGNDIIDRTDTIKIRYARDCDMDAIIRFDAENSAESQVKPTVEDLKYPRCIILAEDDGAIVGYAIVEYNNRIELQGTGTICMSTVVTLKATNSFRQIFRRVMDDVSTCQAEHSEFRKAVWGGHISPEITGGAPVDTSALKIPPKPTKRRFAIISGAVDVVDRTAIQDMYNSVQNMHGGIIDLLLLSSTGAEGLDLKNVRHIHIMEPYWNYGRIAQIKARGIRNDSHKDLPPEEKNVQTYIYLAVSPPGEVSTSEAKTTDEDLYDESVINQTEIESFVEALREVSIECMLNGEKLCRVCAPTGQSLFSSDAQRDLRAPDPCSQVREEQVKASEITVDGVKYYYKEDPKSIYDYRVFEFDKDLNGWRPLPQSDPRYERITDAIKEAIAGAESGKKKTADKSAESGI